ncbi:REP element-mobilizing transposase RayT [Nonlabens dokdonensis]|jgi:REP element-mobilizing transposase RayT|nr:IS200/IS605 family transposase [Nonlabens dokdonensis]PZX40761.1 REP element-mobilizing transposase RayT [Nonlabens dokdonensis]
MSKNNLQIYLHIIFSTKSRNHFISDTIEKKLYPFIWSVIQDNDCVPITINGMPDHVHVLLKMDSKVSLSDLMRFIKGKSSRFLSENYTFLDGFEWQRGYGAFSVSPKNVDKVIGYIKNQKQHHREDSTIEELEL